MVCLAVRLKTSTARCKYFPFYKQHDILISPKGRYLHRSLARGQASLCNGCSMFSPHSTPNRISQLMPSLQGYPEDLVVSVALGADMFDCVWPSRTARFGNAVVPTGTLNLRHSSFASDFGPVDRDCTCVCCRSPSAGGLGITRAYIYHVAAKETVGAHLLTMHNVHYLLSLMRGIREAILEDSYPTFVRDFFQRMYDGDKSKIPSWAVTALQGVGIDLLG